MSKANLNEKAQLGEQDPPPQAKMLLSFDTIVNQWIKTAVVHLHNGILLGHKKEEKFIFCDSLDGPGDHYPK